MIVPAVHDRACGHRGLLPAGRTFPARPAPLQFPAPVMAAGGADEAVGPAPGGEMPGTGGFIGKARLEGGAGHGAVIVPAAGHHETLHEHPADAHQKLNISSNRAQRDKPLQCITAGRWRREWDSNPRYGLSPYNGLANRRLRPLGHPSGGVPRRLRHAFLESRPERCQQQCAVTIPAPRRPRISSRCPW